MIPTCNGFKACWLKNQMLLSPIFGSDTLNFTKDKFTGHELGCVRKSILEQNFEINLYCLEQISEKNFVFRKLRDVKIN